MSRILPIIALILSAVIFFAYIGPTWSGKIASAKAAIKADDETQVIVNQYKKQEGQLANEKDSIDPTSYDLLTTFLPDSVDNVGLILDLNALATRSQLSLSSINVAMNGVNANSNGTLPAAGADPYGSVNLSLSAVGTFSALQDFLAGIEKSARLLDIQNLSVKGSDTGVYTYTMSIRLYWLR